MARNQADVSITGGDEKDFLGGRMPSFLGGHTKIFDFAGHGPVVPQETGQEGAITGGTLSSELGAIYNYFTHVTGGQIHRLYSGLSAGEYDADTVGVEIPHEEGSAKSSVGAEEQQLAANRLKLLERVNYDPESSGTREDRARLESIDRRMDELFGVVSEGHLAFIEGMLDKIEQIDILIKE